MSFPGNDRDLPQTPVAPFSSLLWSDLPVMAVGRYLQPQVKTAKEIHTI